ncbi:MAG TPA: nucleotidyltransferase domain-containing protein [Methylocystis sp.]|nr:nucleotidyltransferase domain-containing protein [Methylocystis sp.]
MAAECRLDRIIEERTARRLEEAQRRTATIMAALAAEGVDAAVIGSLAKGTFRAHSDIDILVRSPVDPALRLKVERIAANALRDAGIPYDLIYASDLTPAQLEEFENDLVETRDIRQA